MKSTLISDLRTSHVVVCSGRSRTARDENCRRLRDYIGQHPETSLAELAYTTTARRVQHPCRSAYAVSSIDALIKKLESPSPQPQFVGKKRPPVVFAFTGQSVEYTGMGAGLYNTNPTFRHLLDAFQAICNCQYPNQPPFIDIFRGDLSNMETATPTQIQVAIVVVKIAVGKFWESIGVVPDLVIRNS